MQPKRLQSIPSKRRAPGKETREEKDDHKKKTKETPSQPPEQKKQVRSFKAAIEKVLIEKGGASSGVQGTKALKKQKKAQEEKEEQELQKALREEIKERLDYGFAIPALNSELEILLEKTALNGFEQFRSILRKSTDQSKGTVDKKNETLIGNKIKEQNRGELAPFKLL